MALRCRGLQISETLRRHYHHASKTISSSSPSRFLTGSSSDSNNNFASKYPVINCELEDVVVRLKSCRIRQLELNLSAKYFATTTNNPEIMDPTHPRIVPWKSPLARHITDIITPGPSSSQIVEDPSSSRISPPAVEDAPDNSRSQFEKQAARLIVIRRIKMNKHKLKKLRKKMRFRWLKVKERRYIRKEKAYLDEKLALIKAAQKFDAKEYVAGIIRRAQEEPLPRKWTDPLMPEWYKEQEMEKERRVKRYQKVVNLYLNENIKIKGS